VGEQGRPWEIGKAFDYAAPIGMLHLKSETGEILSGDINLIVNGDVKQHSNISHLIWSVNETIANLSTPFELHPGDLIFSGTPDGVGSVKPGDTMLGATQGTFTTVCKGYIMSTPTFRVIHFPVHGRRFR
jgi:fumarylpyruvate hydrolase